MYKTDRSYQLALCEFMIHFQDVEFDILGTKASKLSLFDQIYKNHLYINEHKPFSVKTDTTCQLLEKNHHPVVRSIKRDYVNFNENDAIRQATTETLNKMAIALIRERVKTEQISVCDAIGLVSLAMEMAYNKHSEIDKEIEQMIK